MDDLFEDVKKYLNTEEGLAETKAYFKKIKDYDAMVDNQVDRFQAKYSDRNKYQAIVDKIIAKYESKEYKHRYYKMHVEPNTSLYFLLLSHAEKYGRPVTESEYQKYGNMFVSSMYYIHGYYIYRMDGQGTVAHIEKATITEDLQICPECNSEHDNIDHDGFCSMNCLNNYSI